MWVGRGYQSFTSFLYPFFPHLGSGMEKAECGCSKVLWLKGNRELGICSCLSSSPGGWLIWRSDVTLAAATRRPRPSPVPAQPRLFLLGLGQGAMWQHSGPFSSARRAATSLALLTRSPPAPILVWPTELSLEVQMPSARSPQCSFPEDFVALVSSSHPSLRKPRSQLLSPPQPQFTDRFTIAFQQIFMKHLLCAWWENLMLHQ